jgi:ubiquinone/menaquinone biosynthesis methyltransferase
MEDKNLYQTAFVKNLFDEMSKTYGLTNLISSLGFCKIWRGKCVNQIVITPEMKVCDLMTGMGECWGKIDRKLKSGGSFTALDFSSEMCRKARENSKLLKKASVEILEEDVFQNSIAPNSIDCIISTFGLKTFSDEQKKMLAAEIKRILKPNGVFSLLEISVPLNSVLKIPYMIYLKHIIPLIGKLLLGNPDNYKMLGIYTEKFGNCRKMKEFLEAEEMKVQYKSFFFGCASGLVGQKINE